jgi:hypothetical protein
LTEQSKNYTLTYTEGNSTEKKQAPISSPHSIDRTREILAEIHPEWDIISIILRE